MCKPMSAFFRLLDDVHLRGRWHLGELFDQSGAPVDLDLAQTVGSNCLRCDVSIVGAPLEFSLTGLNAPIARARLASAMQGVAAGDLQLIPVVVDGCRDVVAVNIVRTIRCLDDAGSSSVMKWGAADGRPDKVGHYRMVTGLRITPELVPEDAHIFRVEGWPVALIVSRTMKESMERAGCRGAVFVPVA